MPALFQPIDGAHGNAFHTYDQGASWEPSTFARLRTLCSRSAWNATLMRLRRTPRHMPKIGARPARPQAASPSNTFIWILAAAKEPIWLSELTVNPTPSLSAWTRSPSASPMPRRESASRSYPTHSSCPEALHRFHSCLPQASSMPSPSTFPRRSPRPSTPKNDSSMSTT